MPDGMRARAGLVIGDLLAGSCRPGSRLMVWPVLDAGVVTLPRTLGEAVRAEFAALGPPYETLITVAANGALMSVAWFFMPGG